MDWIGYLMTETALFGILLSERKPQERLHFPVQITNAPIPKVVFEQICDIESFGPSCGEMISSLPILGSYRLRDAVTFVPRSPHTADSCITQLRTVYSALSILNMFQSTRN